MIPDDLWSWSFSQLFTFIQLVACHVEAFHNNLTTEHEKQKKNFFLFFIFHLFLNGRGNIPLFLLILTGCIPYGIRE